MELTVACSDCSMGRRMSLPAAICEMAGRAHSDTTAANICALLYSISVCCGAGYWLQPQPQPVWHTLVEGM